MKAYIIKWVYPFDADDFVDIYKDRKKAAKEAARRQDIYDTAFTFNIEADAENKVKCIVVPWEIK